jgi:uncharacterized DUF497 family protein
MNYVWDPKKNRRNVARHGIAFEDAIKIFEGPLSSRWTNAWITARYAFTLWEW